MTSSAGKFTELFDNGWKSKTSALRTQGYTTRKYDYTSSWDGKVEDPESFSRLKNTTMAHQQSNPVALLAGGAVLNLDSSVSFEPLNVRHKPNRGSTIPLTLEQNDLGMESCLRGSVPVRDIEARQNNGVVLADMERFHNLDLTKPAYKAVVVPTFMVEAGPQCDQKLLNPPQRREIMIFDKQRLDAEKSIKSAKAFREKSRKQAKSATFQRGILMVDSSGNEDSEIYGDTAIQRRYDHEQKHQIYLERQNNLARRNSATAINGDFIIPSSIPSNVLLNETFQSKGGGGHSLSFDETYNRVFIRRLGNPAKSCRTQTLRDNDLNGKNYNLMSHTLIEHWPSRDVVRLEDKGLNHPSQRSLESVRNLQGTSTQRQNYY